MDAGKHVRNVLRSRAGNGMYHSDHFSHFEAKGILKCSWSPAIFPGKRGKWTWCIS